MQQARWRSVSGSVVLKCPQWKVGCAVFVCFVSVCGRGALISPLFEGLGPTKEELAKADEGRELKSGKAEELWIHAQMNEWNICLHLP